jgi:hypothetical protein
MRPEPEGVPDLAVPVRCCRAPVTPMSALGSEGRAQDGRSPPLASPSVDDHGDARVVAEALVELLAEPGTLAADHDEPTTQPGPRCRGVALMAAIGTGRRPGDGADTSGVDPVSIAVLAIVRVVTRGRRQGSQLGQGVHQPLRKFLQSRPKNLPVLSEAGQTQASEKVRPAVSKRIVHRDSPGTARALPEAVRPYHFPQGRDRQIRRLLVADRQLAFIISLAGGHRRRRIPATARLSGAVGSIDPESLQRAGATRRIRPS